MKCLILLGSPRPNGNTASLIAPFAKELRSLNIQCETVWLYEKKILPCTACRGCQGDWASFACVQRDDMQEIAQKVLDCGLLVLASPIYSWYCTPPMKAALDRLVYGLNKYYGTEKGPSLWAGKQVAIITTCGYRPERGADLWEEGMRRYCKHSGLRYRGMLAQRHLGYDTVFFDDEKERCAREFARSLALQE